jgi:hypothetical protein
MTVCGTLARNLIFDLHVQAPRLTSGCSLPRVAAEHTTRLFSQRRRFRHTLQKVIDATIRVAHANAIRRSECGTCLHVRTVACT